MADVQAVILAGGKGTRLRPVTTGLPKPLVPVANRPLIHHQLEHLAQVGVNQVTLSLGENAERFEGVEDEAERLGMQLQVITEPEPLGTGGALRYCYDQGAFDDRPLFWLNGDVVAAPDVEALYKLHTDKEALLTFWLTSVRDIEQFGVLEMDDDGRIVNFREKPALSETDSRLVNSGILMLDPAVLQRVPQGRSYSFEGILVPEMVKNDEALYGHFDGGYWLDTGRPRNYLDANRHVLERRIDWTPAGHEVVEGLWEGEGVQRGETNVIRPAALGDGVQLEETARLFGRTVLGDRNSIGETAMLEDSVLFGDVSVGADTEIVNSIVCAGAHIGARVRLVDTIIGAEAVVGDRNQLLHARLSPGANLPEGTVTTE